MIKDVNKAQAEAKKLELELDAIKNVIAAIEPVDADAKQRVLSYVLSRLAQESPVVYGHPSHGIGIVR